MPRGTSPASKKQKKKGNGSPLRAKQQSPGPNMERIAALSQKRDRPELLDTPGAYQWDDTRDNRKVPYVFRTGQRFPPPKAPMKDTITINMEAIEAKSKVATISNEPRWPEVKEIPPVQYDVDRGRRATEAAPPSASFSTRPRELHDIPATANTSIVAPYDYLTIGRTHIQGGRFTDSKRDTSEHFIKESGGKLYGAKLDCISPKPSTARFTSGPRFVEPKTVGPGPLAYSDAASQRDKLSTSHRSPTVQMSNVPSASSMPYPYNPANVWNSRSMRTKFCVSQAVAKQQQQQQHSRPQSAASTAKSFSTAASRKALSPIPRPLSANSVGSAARSLLQRRGGNNNNNGKTSIFNPIDSPFSSRCIDPSTTLSHSTVSASAASGHHADDPDYDDHRHPHLFQQQTAHVVRCDDVMEERDGDEEMSAVKHNYHNDRPPTHSSSRPGSAMSSHSAMSGGSDVDMEQQTQTNREERRPSPNRSVLDFDSSMRGGGSAQHQRSASSQQSVPVEPVPRFFFAAKYPEKFRALVPPAPHHSDGESVVTADGYSREVFAKVARWHTYDTPKGRSESARKRGTTIKKRLWTSAEDIR